MPEVDDDRARLVQREDPVRRAVPEREREAHHSLEVAGEGQGLERLEPRTREPRSPVEVVALVVEPGEDLGIDAGSVVGVGEPIVG
jgi:hypothetical protein